MNMRPSTRRSIVTEIAWPLLLAFLPLALIGFAVIQQRLEHRLTDRFDHALLAQLHALAGVTRFEVADAEEGHDEPWVEFDFDPENYPGFDEGEHAEFFRLWVDGAPMARSRSWPQSQAHLDLDASDAPALDTSAFGDTTLPDGRRGRLARWTFLPSFDEDWHSDGARRADVFSRRHPGMSRPPATIEVAVARAPLDETLADLRWNLALPALAIALVGAAMIPWLVRRGLGSLRLLNERLGGIDAHDLGRRVSEDGLPQELLPVASASNALLGRVEAAFEKERLFSRNVAHELRTPIAELRSLGEVGEAWPDDPEANARFFALIGESARRMDRLVSNLLMLAQQEQGAMSVVWEVLDLKCCVESAMRRNGDAESHGVEIQASTSCAILADATLLDSILNNLIDNMLQYRSSAEGCVIRLDMDDATASLTLRNAAAGLAQEDMPHLADRFWRKDGARTAGRHAGLGLSLVRSLCRAMQWQLEIELQPESMLVIKVLGIRGADSPMQA